MSKITEAVKLIEQIAADNSHGYQWGGNGPGDFDCSGLINYVWQSVGVPVNAEVRNTTRTMKTYYCRHGFQDVTGSVNVKTGAGLQPGDVLVNTENHTAMYVGNGKIVQARSNLDGKSGDSSGQEIREQNFYNYPWNTVLRYSSDDSAPSGEIPVTGGAPAVTLNCEIKLPTLRFGDQNEYVRTLQLVLIGRGCSCGSAGADGELGYGTKTALLNWQRQHGLTADAICGAKTWASVLAGK